jgi:hypothetical protein
MPSKRTTTRSASQTRGDANAGSDAPAVQRYRSSRDSQAEVYAAADSMAWTVTPSDVSSESTVEAAIPPVLGWPFPPVRRSGVYRHSALVNWPLPPLPAVSADPATAAGPDQQHGAADTDLTVPAATRPAGGQVAEAGFPFRSEELRVDVDGLFPTMTVSGTISGLFIGRLTWIARVTRQPSGTYVGPITYRDGNAALRPHANVTVTLHELPFAPPFLRFAEARFSGGPTSDLVLRYRLAQPHFRDVAFEYDTVSDATSVTTYNPSSHPNHPPAVPNTTLSLESAYARLGIRVTKTGGDSVIPIGEAGANTTWSDQEMHDAMQAHWSRWMDAPQWAVWVLFARLHDIGTSLGGIMFDDIGQAQRQGCAIFSDSFISQAPAGEANPGPWVQRMRFWTAAHEIGHSFNLAHSWQESLGTPWIPLQDEPAALSYMNYPYFYPGGTDPFFASFEFTFSPNELLFLRHAPERFVEQGAELWFVNHGFEHDAFEQLRKNTSGALELAARVHRVPRFEFLEPVVVELRLKNTSSTACIVDANALAGNGVAIVVQKEGAPPQRWLPLKRICAAPQPKVLQPGEAIYAPVFLSASTSGWLISEPGTYRIYAAAQTGSSNMALSRPLEVMVDRPASSEAERLAGDVFSRQVAHTLAFGGSRVLSGANDTLREVTSRLPDSRLAMHARAALGAPLADDGKVLVLAPDGVGETIAVDPARPQEASPLLSESLQDFAAAADSLGHIGVAGYASKLASVLGAEGNTEAQQAFLNNSAATLERRGVLPEVVQALRQSAGSD